MNYEQFHSRMVELNEKERSNKLTHTAMRNNIDDKHKQMVRNEEDRYLEEVRRENRQYNDKQDGIRIEKSKLRYEWIKKCRERGEEPYGTTDDGMFTNGKHRKE